MALIDHTQLFNRFELLIWEIKNSDKIEAIDLPNNILKKIDSNKSQLKKNQILAVHQILKHRNIPSQDLFYNTYGAPFLTNGLNISISHSELFVAGMVRAKDPKGPKGSKNLNFILIVYKNLRTCQKLEH